MCGQSIAYSYMYVISEPVVREHGVGGNGDGGLVCDLGVRGVWNPQRDVLLDFKVVNTDATSYIHRPVRSVLESAAAQKKAKHKQACAERRADFTPFICSTDGAIHREGQDFLRRLSAGWRRNGRCPTVELWASSTCDCRWPSCALQFTVWPGGSFSPSPMTQEQPSPYFPRLSSFCSHFLLVALSSLLSMPGLQTF